MLLYLDDSWRSRIRVNPLSLSMKFGLQNWLFLASLKIFEDMTDEEKNYLGETVVCVVCASVFYPLLPTALARTLR